MSTYNWLHDEVVGEILGDKVIPLYMAITELNELEADYQEKLEEANSNPSNISFDDALDIVLSTDNWFTNVDLDSLDISQLSEIVTESNAESLVYSIANGSSPSIARKLYTELQYYVDKKVI